MNVTEVYFLLFLFLVANFGEERCDHPHVLQLYPETGLISSVVADELGMGSRDCPWVIRLEPGRRVNFTLMNFADVIESDEDYSEFLAGSSQPCQTYVRLHEKNKVVNISGCVGDVRERMVYISDTNIVRVEIVPDSVPRVRRKFLLKHQGKFTHFLSISSHFYKILW